MVSALVSFLLAATLDVPPGADLAEVVGRARPGDVVRVPAGRHVAALGSLRGVRVEGAGAGLTVVEAPEGVDGAWAAGGEVSLSGLTLRAGPERCGLVVRAGTASLDDVGLTGGACGVRVDAGALRGKGLSLHGRTALVVAGGDASLSDGDGRGERAAVLVNGGALALERFTLSAGRAAEAALVAASGRTRLSLVVVFAPGDVGVSASSGAEVEGDEVTVVGAGVQEDEIPGACLLARKATVRLTGGMLARCGGAALQALGGSVHLTGVDASGGVSGCLLFLGGARAELAGNACGGRGPGVLATGGAQVAARKNLWWTDPLRVVDCASGSRMTLGPGERGPVPCTGAKPATPLDKRPLK
ncbi:MAG: hypothetical protein QM704_10440 [Anaeromyxobacteraceae bacterium]